MKTIERPLVYANPDAAPPSPIKGRKTLYVRNNQDGRLLSRQVIRGSQDVINPAMKVYGPIPTDEPVPSTVWIAVAERDLWETWTYYGASEPNAGQLASYTDARGLTTQYESYQNGRLIQSKVESKFGTQTETTITVNAYDDLGQLKTITTKTSDGQNEKIRSINQIAFDTLGMLRRVAVLAPDGDNNNLSNNPILSEDKYEYAPDGQTLATIDGNGVRHEWEYDLAGLLTQETIAKGQSYYSLYTGSNKSVEQVTQYNYYQHGSLKSLNPPGHLDVGGQTDELLIEYFSDPFWGEQWVSTSGVSAGGAHPNKKMVTFTRLDVLGRTLVEKNLLTGAETHFAYQDGRHGGLCRGQTDFSIFGGGLGYSTYFMVSAPLKLGAIKLGQLNGTGLILAVNPRRIDSSWVHREVATWIEDLTFPRLFSASLRLRTVGLVTRCGGSPSTPPPSEVR